MLVALLLLALVGCGGGPDGADEAGAARTQPDTAPVSRSGVGAAEGVDTVRVWFRRGEAPVAVERVVEGAPLPGALRALVAGPTPEERAAGLTSWFSDSTAQVLRSVALEDEGVIVDFRDLPELIPNASTSAGSAALLTSLDSTVFQFPWVRWVEYRLDGSCEAFWNWLQRSCDAVER